VGCRGEAGKAALIRIVRGTDGVAAVDRTGLAEGRGAYLHNDAGCMNQARKRKSLERALKGSIQPELWKELSHLPLGGEG
jgi:predicted RNA-binding protein YlxR (DUF448 family)